VAAEPAGATALAILLVVGMAAAMTKVSVRPIRGTSTNFEAVNSSIASASRMELSND
jgi:hypothetical protein